MIKKKSWTFYTKEIIKFPILLFPREILRHDLQKRSLKFIRKLPIYASLATITSAHSRVVDRVFHASVHVNQIINSNSIEVNNETYLCIFSRAM